MFSLWQRVRRLVISQQANLGNLSFLVVANLFAAGLGFVTQAKIANTLGRPRFGLIAYALALATYSQATIRFGLDRTLVRDLVHSPARAGELVRASLILRGSILVLGVVSLLVWKAFSAAESDLTWGVVLIILANSLTSLDLQAVFDSWRKMSQHAVYRLLQRGIQYGVVWSVIILYPSRLSVLCVGAAMLASVVIYLVIQYRWAFARLQKASSTAWPLAMAWGMAKSNFVVWLAVIGGLSFGRLNQLFLKYYHGASELGSYAAAWMAVYLANILLMQVGRIGNPATASVTASSVKRGKRVRFLIKYSLTMLIVVAPIATAAIAYPQQIINTVFSTEYASAAAVVRLLGVYMIVLSLGVVASQYVLSARLEKAYFMCVCGGGIMTVGTCMLLIPRMGAVGAGTALLLGHTGAILSYWLVAINHVRRTQP